MPCTIEELNADYCRKHVEIVNQDEILRLRNSTTSCTWSAGRRIGDSGWIELAFDRDIVFVCTTENWEQATKAKP